MATLQITCLGDCQINLDGTAPNTFLTEKTRALLIYLVLEPQVHPRGWLTQMLWSGYSEESARNSLRQALHLLRQSLPETETPWLLVTRQTVQINPAALTSVDVTTFIGLLAAAATHPHADLTTCTTCLTGLRQAVDLYRGDFLAGLNAIDSDPFEEWRRVTQEQLHIQMLDALSRLANAAERARDTDDALQAAQRQLTLEPWLESAHRQIMRLLAQRGQRTAALAQYQRCRQVLAEELSVEPDAETIALYEQIRSGGFDKVARRQGDKVTSTSSVTESPNPPVTQSPSHPFTQSPLHPITLSPPPPPERIRVAATPAQLLPLLGRTDELAQMTMLLAQPICRLVTLVGPPGVGKTRLAQALLDASPNRGADEKLKADSQNLPFAQGIHFVELAALRDPTLLATTIAHTLALSAPALQLTGERLTEHLRDQALLLVLDNFEQVLPGVDLLRQILAHCPQIKFLITSRVPLHLPGEQVVPIQPLPLPGPTAPKGHPPQGAVALAMAAQNVAVQLFCQRAAAVVPGFALTERLAPVVVEICRRLDGLPLAIELAAARCRLLPPPTLLERLTQDLPARLALLTSRSPTLPERQQTLRAAIAWSYDLLTAAEQRLFRQMAVFVGGATLSALEAVIAHESTAGDPPSASPSLFDSIEALLDKSLLRQQEPATTQPEDEPRLLMLETLREYSWEVLTATAEGRSTQQRHADYFLTLAETAAPKLHGPEQVAWLDRLALDHDNLWAALDWLVQAGAVTKALRLATALRYFWRVRGHYHEGGKRLLQILARPEAATSSPTDTASATVRARALNAAGYLQWVQGNTDAAQKLLQEALTLGRAVPDAAATAFALRYLGLAADARQERTTARQFLEESLAIYRTLDTPNETALALMYLGDIAFGQQAYAEAELRYQESADLLRGLGNNVVLPYALRHLGYLALVRGNLPTALTLCTESLRLNWAAGEQQGSAAALSALAAVAVAGERWVQAGRLLAGVGAWLTSSRAQLLPIDRTYYEQTQQRLQQHHQADPPDALADEPERLSLEQALAYVQQELTFADEPRQGGDKVTSRPEAGAHGARSVTQSPNHPVTQSPSHPVTPSPATPPHNLPPAPSPLVGRAQALAEIDLLLQRPEVRLVTLIGPGGMGKTRLAVEVGRQQLHRFVDGVWFVPLAAISTPDALPGAIVGALGIALQGSDPRSALRQALHPKQLLLILDNVEQLLVVGGDGDSLGAVDLVVDLLAAAPGVQILVTSRERLKLHDEQSYAVPALTFAPNATLAEAAASSAVRLFVQAMQRVRGDFELSTANLAVVLRICQSVQGMPLGLELAAANAGGAPLTAIADAIEQSTEFLAVEWRDLPARQRSMRAVFAWSWQLLSAAEQHILRQSAIFRGGFTYSAAQAVTGATIPLLTHLTDKSLLQWQATTTGEGSYFIHELLRQFAAEELAAAGEEAAVATRHSEYYLALLAAQQQSLLYHAPRQAIHALRAELDNIRQAWRWGAGHLSAPLVEQSALTLREFCLLTGLITEGVELFTLAAQARRHHLFERQPLSTTGEQQVEERLYSLLLGLLGNVLIMAGRHEEALQQATAALQFAADDTNPEGLALAYLTQGQALRRQGKSAQAKQLLIQVVQLGQAARNRANNPTLLLDLERRAYSWLTSIALSVDDYPLARANIARQLDICRRLQKFAGEAMALTDLVDIEITLGDYALAQQYAEQALTAARKTDFRWAEAACLGHLADIARFQGDYTQAQTLYEQVLTLYHEMGHLLAEAVTSDKLGQLYLQFGDIDCAHTRIGQAFHLLRTLDMPARETCAATLTRAWLNYLSDKPEAALVDAEQGWQMARQLDGGANQASALILVGLIRERLQQAGEAATAYQEALTTYLALGHHHQTVEPRAGLARLALAASDFARANAEVESILPILIEQPRAGYKTPFFVYLTCYRVLAANRDPRAATLLQQGYTLLQQDAAKLDEESRQRFLTAVPLHRDLASAYAEMQAQGDKVTSDKAGLRALGAPAQPAVTEPTVTSTSSVTESPNHPLTLSPPHLVTPSPPHNLPATLTPFVGRTRSIAEILSRLQQGVRLLTLVGPGGTGKTRLALAVGQQLLATYPDGVWFVALAALTNPAAIATAIATALRLPITGNDARTALAQLLQPKRLLLILDNFEQLLVGSTEGVELVAALLQAAPGVQMLVTSRERLQLRSEQLYQVPPLSVAPNATLAEATTASAARLFVQSAQFVQADFQLTPTNLAAVLRICDLVQGMPLGLELAAAQVGTLSLAAIGDAIAQSAEFLAVDWVDVPARQRSMRAIFAWSWQLLDEAEQRALRQLSIFRGGFTREAAQAITGVTLPTLTRLVHCSLLHWSEPASEGRYAIHELLRQFATEELARITTEQEEVAARHSEFYLNYLAAREMRLTRTEPRAAAAEIQVEFDNIRQAWQGATQRLAFSALQRSAWALFSFYRHTGSSSEALQTFQALAEQILLPAQPDFVLGQRPPHDPPQSRLVAIYAYLLTLQSKLAQAIKVAQQALTLAQVEEATDAAALSQLSWGQALRLQGRLAEAQPHLEQTLQLARLVTDPTVKSDLLYDVECLAGNALGALASDWGIYPQAREHFGRSLHLAQSLGKRRLEINALLNLANLARMAGEYPAARQGYEDALRLTREVGYRWGEGISQYELGHVLRRQGEYSHAATLLENVLLIFQEIGEHFRKGSVLIALGQLYAYLGDITAAEGWLTRYQQFIDQTQVREATIHHLHACTALAFHREDLVQALAYATEGWQIGQTQGLPDIQAYGLIGMGHAQRQLGQWAAATTAYQQAFDLYRTLQRPDLAAEAQAGLAALAQQQGDLSRALGLVETVLAQVAVQPVSGQDEPFFLYLTCYQVLAAAQDPRAPTILQQGYALLQRYADQITEDRLRQSFLEKVPVHRALQQAYAETRDKVTRWQGDKVTNDKVTNDKVTNDKVTSASSVTESPPHPVTPSPSHPLTQSPLRDWAEMPVVDFFVERRAEVAQLTTWLTPVAASGVPAQLISILGMGGMGKTTLAAAVTKAVAPNFAVVIWRSLLNAPPLSELLRGWLQTLSRQSLSALPESVDEQLRLLLTYLQQERCLLVLDNVESIFVADAPTPEGASQPQSRAGVMQPGYEGYDQLLQRLASSEHQSCLLLTSREQPYALLRVAAGQGRQTQTPSRLQVLPLTGLDQAAGQALLASNGLHAATAEAVQLIENYSGNPLALQIVASTIADFFGGDVAAFQQEEGQIFDGMRLVLDQQFARLSPLEREILLWLAIEREPVTVPLLRSNFVQLVATAPLLEALQALQNRSLLEKRDSGFTLQNVIIEYATEYLVQQVCQEIVEDMVTESPSLPWQGHPITQSFLNRFALLKAQSKEYTRQSQERLILQPVAAHWRRRWDQGTVRIQVQQMLNELREKGTRRGYAAGNLLNLLIHLGLELNGYDFSGLSVWQADLRRSTVQHVNLAQADLSSSAFTQTFSRIECVAISPDGQLLAAAGDGGAIRLFRLPNGEPHLLLTGHTNTITSVAFSPDGAYLASTGDDGTILLWTIPDGRLHRQLNEQMPMRVVVFSPDGRLLAGASRNGAVLLWQVESGHLRQTLPLHRQRVNALAFHPDGNLLASAGSDGAIYLVEVSKVLPDANAQLAGVAAVHESPQGSQSVRTLAAEPEARFFAATFSPDGKRLVAGSGDGKLHVWDAPFDQRTSQTRTHQGEIRAVTFCADSRLLFSAGNDGVIRLWDSTDMHCCQTLTGHKETVYALALGLHDRLMASGSEDATICLWEVNPQTQSILRQRMVGYPQALECVAWSGCGRWLATGDIHGAVRLWDLQAETPRCTQEIRGKSTVIALTFTPDGQQLVIGRYADPAGIQLWAVGADDQWQLRSGYRIPTAGIACFSPNGSLLATCTSAGDIHLWNAQTLKPCAGTSRLIGHSSYVNRVAFSAEGQLVASCSNDLTVRLWQIATGEEILRLPGYGNNTCLALNAQGTLLACSSPNFGIALWHLADRTAEQPLHTLMGHTNEAFACAFSPDGKHLVSVGLDRSVRLWDVQTGVQRTLLGYHEQYALDVAFSPAGKQVATIGKEGALHLWQIDTYECLHQLHAPGPYAGMNITGVTGISEAQKAALRALGAVEE